MARTYQFGDPRPAERANCKPANRKAAACGLAWTLLLILGALEMPFSSGLLVAQTQSTELKQSGLQQSGLPQSGLQQSDYEPTLRAAAAADIPFTDYDSAAEEMLLDLANQARSKAGAPALKLDSGLSQAARAHAEAMLSARQLSHQLQGERSLVQRIAAATRTPLDQEAENVALDYDPEDGHRHLMMSPPHRANLLNPAYNVIGIAVVHAGDRLYIVQDFAHALPAYSVAQVKDQVAAAIAQARHRTKQPDLARENLATADEAACSMAKADKLGSFSPQQLARWSTVVTYTSLHPEILPSSAGGALAARNLRSYSIGACYARTETYATGVYWVVLALE